MSQRIAEEITALFEEAARRGVIEDALGAYMEVLDQLEADPMNYGEARDILPAMGIRVRIAFASPLIVRFGVHESQPVVWLQKVLPRIPGRR